jgi:hypothetical protein
MADRKQLVRKIEAQRPVISHYWEKHGYWSPSAYLGQTSSQLESQLSGSFQFTGPMVESSQGMSDAMLRQPSDDTADYVASFLSSPDSNVRLTAAQLFALYLEATSGSGNYDANSIARRLYCDTIGQKQARDLLISKDVATRQAAALILGNTLYNPHVVQDLTDAFNRESDQSTKIFMAWAYWSLHNNYPRTGWHLKQRDARVVTTP